jgi:hypothetical protein
VLIAVGNAVDEVPLGLSESPLAAVHAAEVRERPACAVADSSSRSSTRAPASAATSSTSRAGLLSRAARASTASWAEAGTVAIPAATTSVT